MARVHGRAGYQRMVLNKVMNGGDVKARFIPEKWQPQQWRMKQENCGKDNGKNLEGEKARRPVLQSCWQSQRILSAGGLAEDLMNRLINLLMLRDRGI